MAYTGTSIVDYLKSEGQDSSFSARKKLAAQMGIQGYQGTAAQNSALLKQLRQNGAQQQAGAAGNGAQAGGTAAPAYEQARPQYDRSEALTQLEQTLAQKEQGRQEEYASPYQERIEALLAQALEREAFSYDPNADPLYRQYESAYRRGGKQAMEDTMANAAALTGGYGNSYASTAGNQAYQSYLAELNQILPVLYQSAYDRYRDSYGDVLEQLGLLQELDAGEYEKYRDTVADYYSDLNYYYRQYGDLSEREYQQYLTDLEQWAADRDYYYQKQQDEQAQANWEAEFALAQAKRSGSGASGGSSKKSSSAKKEGTEMTQQAQSVLQAVLSIRDAGRQQEYVQLAVKKGRITKAEAAQILKQL